MFLGFNCFKGFNVFILSCFMFCDVLEVFTDYVLSIYQNMFVCF